MARPSFVPPQDGRVTRFRNFRWFHRHRSPYDKILSFIEVCIASGGYVVMYDTYGTKEEIDLSFTWRIFPRVNKRILDRDMFYNIELHWPGGNDDTTAI